MYCQTTEACCSLFELGGFYGSPLETKETIKADIIKTIENEITNNYLYDNDSEIPSAFIATTLEHKQKKYGEALKSLGFTRKIFKSRHKDQDRLFLWTRTSYPPGIKQWLNAELKKERTLNDNW
jgi:hypothetical protein